MMRYTQGGAIKNTPTQRWQKGKVKMKEKMKRYRVRRSAGPGEVISDISLEEVI